MSTQNFSILHHFYLSDKRLSASDKIVLAVITNYDKMEFHCTASYDRLAEICGMSSRTIIKSVNTLENLGYIQKAYTSKNSKTIISNVKDMIGDQEDNQDSLCKNFTPTMKKIHSHYEKNSHKKNIYNNNIKEYISKNSQDSNSITRDKYIYNNNIKELRSEKPDLLNGENHLAQSMKVALSELADSSGKKIRGFDMDDSFMDKMMYIAKSYDDRYFTEYGVHHPFINPNDMFSPMQIAVLNMVDGDRSLVELSNEDIDLAIDLFFKNEKFAKSDHHISLFANPNVWIRRVKEVERLTGKPGFYNMGIDSQKQPEKINERLDPNFWDSCMNKRAKIAL